jgi:hypothetical protein
MNFHPRHTTDGLLGEDDAFLPLFVYPWGAFSQNQPKFKDPITSRFCGPSSMEFVREEFARFRDLYFSIKQNGYSVFKHSSNQIAGTFLIAEDGSSKFVVMQGNHRAAVLAGLGWKRIPVRVQPSVTVPNIYFSDRQEWSFWNNHPDKRILMERIFLAFFQNNGTHIRNRIATGN